MADLPLMHEFKKSRPAASQMQRGHVRRGRGLCVTADIGLGLSKGLKDQAFWRKTRRLPQQAKPGDAGNRIPYGSHFGPAAQFSAQGDDGH